MEHARAVNSAFLVRTSDTGVEGWAAAPLPFEPKGAMLEYRQALRRALGQLAPTEDRVLHGEYASADPRHCDVENLLLYNVGVGAFSHLGAEEVVLTRSWSPPPVPPGAPTALTHYHRYDIDGPRSSIPSAPPLATLAPTGLRLPVRVETVWYDIRAGGRMVGGGVGANHLDVRLNIHRPPAEARPAMLGMVKAVVDGFVAALHSHDGSRLDVVTERLGARLGVPAERVGELLVANPAGVLGARRLLWPFGDFVQWNPADDAIVRLQLTTTTSSSWLLSGTLSALHL